MYNHQGARKMKSRLGLKVVVFVFFLSHIECSFRSGYTYSVVARAWFKHSVTPATWSVARIRCSLEGATLASPTTPEIKAEMMKILQEKFSSESEIFTGIRATFCQRDNATVEGIPVSTNSLSWAENEAEYLNNYERCSTLNYDGDFAVRSCSDTHPYICYKPSFSNRYRCGSIDSEYRLNTRTNSCYKFHTSKRTFSDAYLACSTEGGQLAVINSETEASVIRWLFITNRPKNIIDWLKIRIAFIGFTDRNHHGDWRTIHGQTLEEAGYSKFCLLEPNNFRGRGEYCGSVYCTGRLNDVSCDVPHEFICEKNPNYPIICKIDNQDSNIEYEK